MIEPGVESNKQKVLQSSVLHLMYQHTRITIHRPFVACAATDSQLSLSSLTICTSAARAVVHLMQAQRSAFPGVVLMVPIVGHLAPPSFTTSGLTQKADPVVPSWYGTTASRLVSKACGHARRLASRYERRLRRDPLSRRGRSQVCAVVMVYSECLRARHRWPLAGRLKDLLRALASVGELPLPLLPSTKRNRIEEFDDYGEQASLPTLRMPPPSQQQPPQYPTDVASDSFQQSSKHVLERLVPSTSSEMSVFGPPLARRDDGLYAFDPASTGMSTSARTYANPAAPNSSQGSQTTYQSNPTTQPGYSFPTSYPSIPLNPGAAHPVASYAPTQSPESYRSGPAGDYLSQADYSSFLSAVGSSNRAPSSSQPYNVDDSQFMSLLVPAMAQDAPMATMWSSLPATFQYVSIYLLTVRQILTIRRPEDWDRYVSTMADFAGSGHEAEQQGSAFGQPARPTAAAGRDRAPQYGYLF